MTALLPSDVPVFDRFVTAEMRPLLCANVRRFRRTVKWELARGG